MASDRFAVLTGNLTPRELRIKLNDIAKVGKKVITVSIGGSSCADIREGCPLPCVIVTEDPYA